MYHKEPQQGQRNNVGKGGAWVIQSGGRGGSVARTLPGEEQGHVHVCEGLSDGLEAVEEEHVEPVREQHHAIGRQGRHRAVGRLQLRVAQAAAPGGRGSGGGRRGSHLIEGGTGDRRAACLPEIRRTFCVSPSHGTPQPSTRSGTSFRIALSRVRQNLSDQPGQDPTHQTADMQSE